MNKHLWIATVFVFTGLTSSFAQERNKGDIEIAPYAGIHLSNAVGDQTDGLSTRSAATFGIHADYFLNDRFSLRSGLDFLPMGIRASNSELDLNYLSVPVQGSFHFGDTRRWNVVLGINNGFLMNAEIDGVDVKDQTASYQLAITYGIGYRLVVSDQFSILFEILSNYSVTDYLKTDDFSRRNTSSSLNIGGLWVF
jgi:hypothetical protein